jgi:eukaryotic-like serine/threonine-protein kinase
MSIEQLGPYRIERPLGHGGMGTVYAAVEAATGHPAAIKVLSPRLGREAGFRERFAAEIESLRKLRHPNIVRLIGFGEEDDCYYYAMELVAGPSLEEELKRRGRFRWQQAADFGLQICRALKHAHDRGIIHRDIKPANLLLAPGGELKLSDFGIAKLFGHSGLTADGGIIGTAEYMAPEQADGRPATERCDLYSLGGVLYALLAGRPPFVAKSLPEMLQLQRFAEPELLRRFAPEAPVEFEEIILQLLAKEPEARIPGASVVSRRLEAMRQGLAQQDEPVSPEESEPPQVDGPATAFQTTAAPAAEEASEAGDQPPGGSHVLGRSEPLESKGSDGDGMGRSTRRHFIPVGGEDLHGGEPSRKNPSTALQTMGLLAALLAVLVVGWRLLQPPTADVLFARIATAMEEEKFDNPKRLEADMELFLSRYADDPRRDEVIAYRAELQQYQRERKFAARAWLGGTGGAGLSAMEREYLEAMSYAQLDPDVCRRKLHALVELYDDPQRPPNGVARECLQLARAQLQKLDKQFAQYEQDEARFLKQQIERARALERQDPVAARKLWAAIVELFGQRSWAAPLVAEARERLAAMSATP